ncbi:hypothetical protein PMAC_002725 [Pneumocystis sp. 'macacae']|nr:hypothetical protein PMAC_002725 [Pneumocystis sp. 'macacae']
MRADGRAGLAGRGGEGGEWTECPVCGRRVVVGDAEAHVDACLGEARPAKLARVNYALWTESRLRAELRTLGLRTVGDKAVLQRRHAEWVNLWNANTDAARPAARSELVRRLARWERSAHAVQPSIRDIASDAWLRTHRAAFAQLAAAARAGIAGARAKPP